MSSVMVDNLVVSVVVPVDVIGNGDDDAASVVLKVVVLEVVAACVVMSA